MENHKNITLQDVNKQLYFDFSLNLDMELTEGSFAQMKNNMGLTRFSCFRKKRVLIEWILLAFALNVATFASRLSQQKAGMPQ